MKITALTQKGKNKLENEDRIIIGKTILSGGVLEGDFANDIIAIADGVGGNNAGAVASHAVAYELTCCPEITTEQLDKINQSLVEKSYSDDTLKGMATTLSCLSVQNSKGRIYHVGNTRVYALQGGKYLKQLTSDDTTVNYLLSSGRLTEEEAKTYENKSEITACFGGGDTALLKIKTVDIEVSNTALIFTTDGIHDYLTIDEFEDIIEEEKDYLSICKKAMEQAIINGSTDDMSIIIGVI